MIKKKKKKKSQKLHQNPELPLWLQIWNLKLGFEKDTQMLSSAQEMSFLGKILNFYLANFIIIAMAKKLVVNFILLCCLWLWNLLYWCRICYMVLESNCAVQWPIWLTPLYPFELAASALLPVTARLTWSRCFLSIQWVKFLLKRK